MRAAFLSAGAFSYFSWEIVNAELSNYDQKHEAVNELAMK